MAQVINMPRLSDTMEEGVVAKWLVNIGDKVSEGDILAEIETDKATMEVEAVDEGYISELLFEEGENSILVKKYHQFLVWDLMKKPYLTRILEFIFQPFIGKSVVMYFEKRAN